MGSHFVCGVNGVFFYPGGPGVHGLLQSAPGGLTSAHTLLSSSPCSSPAFHLGPAGGGQLCNLTPGMDYTACSRSGLALNRYGNALAETYGRLGDGAFPAPRTTSYGGNVTAATGGGSGGGDGEAFGCTQSGIPIQIPGMPSPQLQYVLPGSPGNAFSVNQSHQGTYNSFRLHNPYGLYGYNFSTSPRLAASPEKIVSSQGAFLGSSPSGTMTDRQMLSPVDGLHMLSSGGQQNLFDSRTLGLGGLGATTSSQVSAHMV